MDLIGTYSKYIRQQHLVRAIVKNNVSLTCLTMINPATCWFEIFKVPTYDLDEVTDVNDEYIDKPSDRVSRLFNNTWLSRYLLPHKFILDHGLELKQDFTPLLTGFYIKTFLETIKIPKDNAPLEQVHQVILNIIGTKDLSNKLFNYIYP